MMLAVFAAYSQKATLLTVPRQQANRGDLTGYISQIVPFYIDRLLEVSVTT